MRFVFVLLALSCSAAQKPPTPEPIASAGERAYPAGMIEVGDIDETALAPVVKAMNERVAAGDKVLLLRINSGGGSIFQGFRFIQQLEEYQKAGVRVQCVVDTMALSMAFVILQGPCQERLVTPRATLLAHNGRYQSKGDANTIESDAAFLRALDRAMTVIVINRLGISPAVYGPLIDGKDWVLTPGAALAWNAADALVDPMDLPPLYKLDPPDESGFLFKLFH